MARHQILAFPPLNRNLVSRGAQLFEPSPSELEPRRPFLRNDRDEVGQARPSGDAALLHEDQPEQAALTKRVLAGGERTTVQNALRQGRLLGLILVKERRIPGRPSLPNLVSIVSKEWSTWLKLGGGGFKKLSPTANQISTQGWKRKDCAGFGAPNGHQTGRQTPSGQRDRRP